MHVLVAAAGQVAQNELVLGQLARQLDRLRGWIPAPAGCLGQGELVEGGQRFLVGDARVFGAAGVLEEGVLGPTPG
jgi:hypothetical protein